MAGEREGPVQRGDLERAAPTRLFYKSQRGEMQGEVYGGRNAPQARVAVEYEDASR